MSRFPPEAEWVTKMREHFAAHGFYRENDLRRVLGNPWDSAGVDADGNLVLKKGKRA